MPTGPFNYVFYIVVFEIDDGRKPRKHVFLFVKIPNDEANGRVTVMINILLVLLLFMVLMNGFLVIYLWNIIIQYLILKNNNLVLVMLQYRNLIHLNVIHTKVSKFDR